MKVLKDEFKPREKCLRYGEQYLTEQELIAILLKTGYKDYDVLQLANDVLRIHEDLAGLKSATVEELQSIRGIGKVKAIELKAALELGVRLTTQKTAKLGKITSSQSAGEYLMEDMRFLVQEHVVVLFLNTKNDILKKKTVFIGSANQAVAEPRDILREAIKIGAISVIVAHNHPSGNPTPSLEDVAFTKRLVECGKLLGITILDHLIIGDKAYVSLREEGIV